MLQSLPSKGSASRGPHEPDPALLTTDQDIEVVLGDTTVLPCVVAHLGKFFSYTSKFMCMSCTSHMHVLCKSYSSYVQGVCKSCAYLVQVECKLCASGVQVMGKSCTSDV